MCNSSCAVVQPDRYKEVTSMEKGTVIVTLTIVS